jgi:hypothetical protein
MSSKKIHGHSASSQTTFKFGYAMVGKSSPRDLRRNGRHLVRNIDAVVRPDPDVILEGSFRISANYIVMGDKDEG